MGTVRLLGGCKEAYLWPGRALAVCLGGCGCEGRMGCACVQVLACLCVHRHLCVWQASVCA